MSVRGLSAGQLYSSLAQATGFRDGPDPYMIDAGGARGRFIDLFANRDEKPTEAQTSILQALTLMNGQIVSGATSLGIPATPSRPSPRPRTSTPPAGSRSCTWPPLTRRPRPEGKRPCSWATSRRPRRPKADPRALADVLSGPSSTAPEFKHNH